MHPVPALLLAMVIATVLLGAFRALVALRDVPEAYEDDDGFWRLADEETTGPARVRVEGRNQTRQQPLDLEA